MNKSILSISIILILVCTAASLISNVNAQIVATSNKSIYNLGETATFTVRNLGINPVDVSLTEFKDGIQVSLKNFLYTIPPGGQRQHTAYLDPSDPNSYVGFWVLEYEAVDTVTSAVYNAQVSIQVTPPGPPFDFTILLSPTSITIEQGETGDFKVLITYSDPSHAGTIINIQVTGLGPGMNFQLSTLGDLKITTSSTTPPGTYPITVIGSAQGKTHQTSGTITITTKAPPFDFSVTLSPSTQTVQLGKKATFTVNVGLVSGTGETVTLSTSGLPGDIQNSLSPMSGTAPFSSTLTVDTATATSTGTFTITVTATGAGKTKTATATLTVEKEADFSVSTSPVSTEIKQGDSVTFTLTLNEVGGFDQPVSLTATGLPSGASPSFSPASGKPAFTSTLTIATSESTPTGSFTVTVDASGGGKTHSATVTLTIKEKPQEATPTTPTTPAGEGDEKPASESNLSTLLSNPTYLMIIVIAVLATALGATALRRGRAPTPAPARPEPSTGYCTNCGEPLKPGEKFCHSCGQQIE